MKPYATMCFVRTASFLKKAALPALPSLLSIPETKTSAPQDLTHLTRTIARLPGELQRFAAMLANFNKEIMKIPKFLRFPAIIREFSCLMCLALPLAAQSLSSLRLEESTDLAAWQSVPVTPEMIDDKGRLVLSSDAAEKFYRLQVEVIRPPSLTAQPAPASVVSGSTATLSVTAGGTGPFTYQWYQGAVGTTTSPVGTNSASFTTSALTATTTYWVRVSNAAGGVSSSLVTVTVNAVAPTITTQPASTTINSGSTATLSVVAGGTAPLTYQWYRGAVGTTTTPVGTNSASFTTPALTATTTYWVRVSNTAGNVNSASVTVTVGDSTPNDMALIPAGSFTMGDSLDGDFDAPPVTVNVSAFFMGKNEVTKALWDEVRTWGAANGYTDLATGAGKASNHPVQTISWWDVVKWCNARSQKEGLTPVYTVSGTVMKTGTTAPTVNWSANGYRLPTEAEWEKAARGGLSGNRFPWGDTISHTNANFWNDGTETYRTGTTGFHPTYLTGSPPYTSPVGAFAANGYGLHDMAGNVREWCWDWYGASTYLNNATDPRGAASGTNRVLRGGGWYDIANSCRVAFRLNRVPSFTYDYIGFRVVRSSVP